MAVSQYGKPAYSMHPYWHKGYAAHSIVSRGTLPCAGEGFMALQSGLGPLKQGSMKSVTKVVPASLSSLLQYFLNQENKWKENLAALIIHCELMMLIALLPQCSHKRESSKRRREWSRMCCTSCATNEHTISLVDFAEKTPLPWLLTASPSLVLLLPLFACTFNYCSNKHLCGLTGKHTLLCTLLGGWMWYITNAGVFV